MERYTAFVIATLVLSLRIGPVLAFAPPFTLMRIPSSVRVLLALALSGWLVATTEAATVFTGFGPRWVGVIAIELMMGILIALSLQMTFAAVSFAGKAIDIQAGFGLAGLADPTLRGQMPLVGGLFMYALAAVFFATGGVHELLGIWAISVERIPPGSLVFSPDLPVLVTFFSQTFVLALGLASVVFLTLFLLDLTIAFMSRTLPQMNVLLLGFQVKTLAVLLTLPVVFSVSGVTLLRLLRLAMETTPELLRG
ncbi:flagellar biosynthetic protein FliR [Maricaulis sp. D1M11]|uniref:flagellar biosynthetic protein FliR n=1 Tax=Maricaulis sp. D1M11 TaxID=3076117 RepID=UPI0039B5B57B